MIVLLLRYVSVTVDEAGKRVTTRFRSGHVADYRMNEADVHTLQQQALARGYTGEDAAWHSVRDHQILHSLLCEIFFGSMSHSLRFPSDDGIASLREWEDGFVIAFQRYINTGEVLPPLYPWVSFLPEASRRWVEIEVQLGKVH